MADPEIEDVSRETIEVVSRETPPQARLVFTPDSLPVLARYAAALATDGVVRGLIGPREADRVWDRHLINCGLLERLIPDSARVCDIGSGAGLPGLVLAAARPDLQVTLVEPLLRRTTFLTEMVDLLGLDNVEVVRGRADLLHGLREFDVVTSRAVAPLPRLVEWSMPLVAPTGVLAAMKGSSAQSEVDQAASDLRRWGVSAPELVEVGEPEAGAAITVVVMGWEDPERPRLRRSRPDQRSKEAGKPRGGTNRRQPRSTKRGPR